MEGETVDVYLSDLRRLVALTGQTDPEPILRCAFVAVLPIDVATQLKSIVAVENLELSDIVARTRMMLTTKFDSPPACAVGHQKTREDHRKYTGYYNHATRDTHPREAPRRQIQCYKCVDGEII